MPKKGQLKGTPARRAEFIEYLRGLGPGAECVYWPWSDRRSGQPRVYVDGQKVIASRWVYQQINGPLPERPDSHRQGATGVLVCHHCDNPPCVRPSHLFPGEAKINTRDSVAKGRHVRGQRRLNDEQVATIRRLLLVGVRQDQLAEAFGVSQGLIWMVANRYGRFV